MLLWFLMITVPLTSVAQDKRYHGDGIDDVLRYVPIVAVATMKIAGCKGDSCSWNQFAINAGGSLVLTVLTTKALKEVIHHRRPDGTDNKGFPSGHTSFAFAGATILWREYGKVSPWITVGGYAAATITAIDRVRRNRHTWDDVLAGAALGFACTEFSYWIGNKILRKNKNCNITFAPNGIAMVYQF